MDNSEYVTLMLVGGHEIYGRIAKKALDTIWESFVREPGSVRAYVLLDEPGSRGSELAVPLRNIVAVRTYK